MSNGVNRRQFGQLLAGGAGGLALGISGSAAAKGMTRSLPPFLHRTGKPFSGEHSVDVVIVGAGLSGLIAARELKRKGNRF